MQQPAVRPLLLPHTCGTPRRWRRRRGGDPSFGHCRLNFCLLLFSELCQPLLRRKNIGASVNVVEQPAAPIEEMRITRTFKNYAACLTWASAALCSRSSASRLARTASSLASRSYECKGKGKEKVRGHRQSQDTEVGMPFTRLLYDLAFVPAYSSPPPPRDVAPPPQQRCGFVQKCCGALLHRPKRVT